MTKIKLKTNLPIDSKHGAKAGAEFEVIRFENRGRGQNQTAIFSSLADNITECAAFRHEYELVEE